MKIVKYSVITVVGLIAILLIVALFLPTHFSVARQALIDKPTNLMTASIKQKIGADRSTSLANLKGILEKESY